MRNVIYFDLDETLVHTVEQLPTHPSPEKVQAARKGTTAYQMVERRMAECKAWNSPHWTHFGFTLVRPGAHHLLETLKQEADLYVFSAGGLDYVEATLKETGLDVYLKGWFSLREPAESSYDQGDAWVLVDNLNPGSMGVNMKVTRVLGLDAKDERRDTLAQRHTLTVPGWEWDPKDELFETLPDRIRERLVSLSR